MHVTPGNVRSLVVDKDDFGFEMRTGAILEKSAHRVNLKHGETYTDPVTGKPRQFDLRLELHREKQRVYLAVECKNIAADNPLIACCVLRNGRESRHTIVLNDNSGFGFVNALQRSPSDFFPANQPVAKTLVREKGEGDVYERWAQALASSHELLVDAAGPAPNAGMRSVVLPVLVVPTGCLWGITYTRDGSITEDPKLLERCDLLVGYRATIGEQKIPIELSHLLICTTEGLESLLEGLATPFGYIADLFQSS